MNDYSSIFRLDGKCAVVTGAAGIIGSQLCRGLLSFGASVVLCDVNEKSLNELADQLNAEGFKNFITVICNVANPKSVQECYEKALAKFKKIDILYNNAATKTDNLDELFAPFETYSLETWKNIFSVNVDGMMLMAQGAGKAMLEQAHGGSIIMTASIYGVLAPDQRIYEGSRYLDRDINSPAVYSASKGAVVMLAKYLSTYWAKNNIRVNSISPGGVESGQNEQFIKNYSNRIPLGRMAKNNEIVGAALFLGSDAANYITGQNIMVDGGLSAW